MRRQNWVEKLKEIKCMKIFIHEDENIGIKMLKPKIK